MIDDKFIKSNYPLNEIFERITGQRLNRHNKSICVFHKEKKASLEIYRNTNRYFCHGCHATGNNIDFVMNYRNTDFKTACEMITGNIQAREPRASETPLNDENKQAEITEATRAIYQFFFNNIGITQQGRNYLYSRGFNDYVINEFKLKSLDDPERISELLIKNFSLQDLKASGMFTENKKYPFIYSMPCVIFPVFKNREPVYFSNRNTRKDCETRFYNLSTSKSFYIGTLDKEFIFIFESFIDAISFYQLTGSDNFIISFGVFKDAKYSDLLRAYPDKKFIIGYDNDNTGNERTKALINIDPERSSEFDYNGFIKSIGLETVDQFKDINDLLILHSKNEIVRLYDET
jgi:DNA primase